MKTGKPVYYSLPFFIIAIVSRSVEEVSFIYYAVPVLCLFYIFYYLVFIRNETRGVIPNKVRDLLLKEDDFSPRLAGDRNDKRSVIPNKVRDLFLREKKSFIIVGLIVIAGLWFLITALWSPFPGMTVKRSLYFILISLGSVFAGMLGRRIKEETKKPSSIFPGFLLPANIIVILLCFFSLITGIPSDSWTLGNARGFAGFFSHQNLLASILLFTMPGVWLLVVRKWEVGKTKVEIIKNKVKYFQLIACCLLLIANLFILILTYSRATLFSLAAGVIVYLVLTKNWKIILYGFLLLLASGILTLSIPPLKTEAKKLVYKDFPTFLFTRQWLWEPSYQAALKGGLTGFGYGISDPSIILPEGTGSHYDGNVYEREKGNTVLALTEETGLIGLILFFLPIIFTIKIGCMNAWVHAKMQSYSHAIILSAIIAFILHSQFEAWMVGVGSVQLPLFFVYIGLLVNSKEYAEVSKE